MEGSVKKALVALSIVVLAAAAWLVFLSNHAYNKADESAQVPLITVMELLHASDLQAGVKQAVENNDYAAIDGWIAQAVEVGKAASLSQQDIDYLHSNHAREYVIFNAKRQLFNQEFEQRYYALEDIASLKTKDPEAKDLFPRAETLLSKRDAIIRQIAETLSGETPPSEAALKEAETQWQAQATSN